jgi:hypothetical protein
MPGKQEVTGFVRSTFRSVWSLELLCLLRKDRDREWRQEEMVAALRGSDLIVAQGLASLAAAGLIVVHADGSAQYRPASARLDELVAAAVDLYARSPDAVRRLIVSSANGGLAAFADAFRVRKD